MNKEQLYKRLGLMSTEKFYAVDAQNSLLRQHRRTVRIAQREANDSTIQGLVSRIDKLERDVEGLENTWQAVIILITLVLVALSAYYLVSPSVPDPKLWSYPAPPPTQSN